MQMQKQVQSGGLEYDASFENTVNCRWENYYNSIKRGMKGTEGEKEDILRKRILKFFQDYHLHANIYYNQRRQISSQDFDPSLIFQSSLLIHGIDFLSLEKIRIYFQPFQVQISFYDDSHCSVTFHNSKQLIECLFTRIINKPPRVDELFDFFTKHPQEMIVWREIEGYQELSFERKLYARFLTKIDDADNNNGHYGRKMMTFFQKAKINFLNQMEKNMQPKHNRSEFKINYGKKWRSETNSSCSDCQERLTKMREIYPCKHFGRRFRKERQIKEEEDEDERAPYNEVPRGRKSRSRGKEYYRKDQLNKLKGKQIKLAPNVEQITGGNTMSNISQNHSAIDQSKQPRSDFNDKKFYNEMLSEFSRYTPFDSISEIDHVDSMSEPLGVSFFERDQGDI